MTGIIYTDIDEIWCYIKNRQNILNHEGGNCLTRGLIMHFYNGIHFDVLRYFHGFHRKIMIQRFIGVPLLFVSIQPCG